LIRLDAATFGVSLKSAILQAFSVELILRHAEKIIVVSGFRPAAASCG
jgi:hypothetical protein